MSNKEITNSQLLTEIKGVRVVQDAQGKRLDVLDDWKRSEDAYRAALAKVKDEEKRDKQDNQADTYLQKRTEIMKQVGIVLALIIAILYAYMATKGIKP